MRSQKQEGKHKSLSEQAVHLKTSKDRQMALYRTMLASQVSLARIMVLKCLAVLSGR